MANIQLAVVMPVYNEEGAICAVLEKWVLALDALGINYRIHAYNDGSKDRSLDILTDFAAKSPQVVVHDKPNSGHGATILQGYRENSQTADWIFQMDSDDEMRPETFATLWHECENYDFLLGTRNSRAQLLPRKIISVVSRLCIRIFYGTKTVWDVNSPYRLMRSEKFLPIFQKIPSDTFAPNLIISGLVARLGLRYKQFPVPHGERKTGEVSIKKWKLLKVAIKSFFQTISFAFSSRKIGF